ncbi:MAG: IscS subfamily cysteine desulfurase [Sedimentisphaerales bacterium]|nr:IscS subfamily cysteine desulfurase [Sedimentisphaerales bacterium]
MGNGQGSSRAVYLDNAATTAVDPTVLEAMLPYFCEQFGNAASIGHDFGCQAQQAVQNARGQVAALLNVDPREIIFTSGATESNNLAIKGSVEKLREKGNHIITGVIEHKAVLDSCKYLETRGFEVTYLPVDSLGMLDLAQLEESITEKTLLISIMAANNEIGTINPIAEIGAIANRHKVLFHCDATQAVGKIPIDVQECGIDLLSLSGHKIYGPKGIGALFIRRGRPGNRPVPQMHGGGHENGYRSGTLNVPAIVGLGRACELCGEKMTGESERIGKLSQKLLRLLRENIDHIKINGHPENRLGSLLNITFEFVEGEGVMLAMPDVAVSSGSACTSATLEPSYVLRAMGIPDELAHGSLRFSLGRFNTEEEIDRAAQSVVRAVKKMRDLSPLYEEAVKSG